MNLTNIFRFRKPEGTDPVNVEDFNDNFDVIDEELNKRPEKTGNASDMVTAFVQAASRSNLTPGEKISVSFGKIMKYFADMKTVAFTGSYADLSNKPSIPGGAAASQAVANNCTTTAAGSVLDARQGKVLMDKANQINSDLGTCRFGITADGRPGYKKAGADTVYPFSDGNIVAAQDFANTPLQINCSNDTYILILVLRAYGKDAWSNAGVSITGCQLTELYNFRADQGGYQGDKSNLFRFIAYKIAVTGGGFQITATGDLQWGDAFKQVSYYLIK